MLGVPPKADVYKIFYPSWLGTPMEFRSATHSYPEDTTECYEYRTTQGLRLLRKSDVDAIKEVFNAFGVDMKLYTQGGDDGNMVKFQGEGILVLLMPLSK